MDGEDGKDDLWLGTPGYRETSSKGEWPVSYHGTQQKFSGSIIRSGFSVKKCIRKRFGDGIYSTPNIEIAADKELYAKPFKVGDKKYQLVFQNRVCPKGLKVVPPSETGVDGEYWIQKSEKHIRPYGICVRHVTDL